MKSTDAENLKRLMRINHPKFNKRGLNCIIHIIDFERKDPDAIRYLFLVQGLETWSHDGGHIVELKFDLETQQAGLISRPVNDDVHVFCQCPAFQYWGPAYNSTNEKYNLDHIENRPPDIRDPERRIKICKHIYRVSRMLEKVSYTGLNKRAGVTAALVETLYEMDDIPVITVQETVPSLLKYLERNNLVDNPLSFCGNLHEGNFETELLRIGAII